MVNSVLDVALEVSRRLHCFVLLLRHGKISVNPATGSRWIIEVFVGVWWILWKLLSGYTVQSMQSIPRGSRISANKFQAMHLPGWWFMHKPEERGYMHSGSKDAK